ncbi:MAG: response regulator [Candidatus Omnitrophica bacterium]|nr:response regulator [Candidatus Omnitrophota bacterium]
MPGGKKILVVEDEKDTLTLLAEGLRRFNFKVETSVDGKDAIQKVQDFMPDVVVLDIILPELDGLEVLKWIKKNKPDIFVMLATGKKELEDIKKGYSLEADYYVTKPYTIDEILKGINVILSFKETSFN